MSVHALPILDAAPIAVPPMAADAERLLREAVGPRDIRSVQTLRISVTDRCNLRCLYCMPEDELDWLKKNELLTYEEIIEVGRAAISLGIRDFKLTGGEPLLRKDLPALIRGLRGLPGIGEISLTSNGIILDRAAEALAAAGVRRVTVSLDTLDPEKFRTITRRGDIKSVWNGIHAADAAGLGPVKLNVVVMRGFNLDEITEFAALTLHEPRTVRFIEFMPLARSQINESDQFVPYDEIFARIESAHGSLSSANRDRGNGPARVFRLPNAAGRIGFIHAMSQPFCATCNRLRLTSDGQLRSCLFDGGEVDLRAILRSKPEPDQLARAFVQCLSYKPDVHRHHGTRQMSQIGG